MCPTLNYFICLAVFTTIYLVVLCDLECRTLDWFCKLFANSDLHDEKTRPTGLDEIQYGLDRLRWSLEVHF